MCCDRITPLGKITIVGMLVIFPFLGVAIVFSRIAVLRHRQTPEGHLIFSDSNVSTTCPYEKCDEWFYNTECMWRISNDYSLGLTRFLTENLKCPDNSSDGYPFALHVEDSPEEGMATGTQVSSINLTQWNGTTLRVDVNPGRGQPDSGGLVSGLFTYRGGSNGYSQSEVDFEWVWGKADECANTSSANERCLNDGVQAYRSGGKDAMQLNVWNPKPAEWSVPTGLFPVWQRQRYELETVEDGTFKGYRYYGLDNVTGERIALGSYYGDGTAAPEFPPSALRHDGEMPTGIPQKLCKTSHAYVLRLVLRLPEPRGSHPETHTQPPERPVACSAERVRPPARRRQPLGLQPVRQLAGQVPVLGRDDGGLLRAQPRGPTAAGLRLVPPAAVAVPPRVRRAGPVAARRGRRAARHWRRARRHAGAHLRLPRR
eukprot:1405794-Prymnesium_polylepis.1